MNRIRLQQPSRFPFFMELDVRITDLNYGNHVGNQVFLAYLQEARVAFLRSIGYDELSFEGVGLIMADAAIEFRAEIKFPARVVIEVAPGSFSGLGFDLHYRIQIIEGDSKRIAALAKTGMVCFDYEAKKTVTLPEQGRKKLESLQP